MAATESAMVGLGTQAPDFTLPDATTQAPVGLTDLAAHKALLVIFLSQHCPYVQHVAHQLAQIGSDYHDSGLGIVGISSNDVVRYPDDSPEHLSAMSRQYRFTFPILWDETQEVARAYGAQCTPDFFLFDANRELVYRGELDRSRPGNDIPVTGDELRAAIDAVLADTPVATEQHPSVGCSIKWK